MLLLLVLALAGCVVGQSVTVDINVTANATGANASTTSATTSVHTYPPTAAPNATAGDNATTAPPSGVNVTSNATETGDNATGTNVTCADQTSQQLCTTFGRGAGGESTDYRACVWCGVSATDGLCREPVWSGNYSCPLENGSFFNYGCLPGDSVAACGSHCINVCETVCRDYRAPVFTITMYNDSSCTQVVTAERNLTRACLPLSNGGSIGLITFANNTYSELNYMCSDCRPCEPTCTNQHNYCECTKVAGLPNLYMVIGPHGPANCPANGTQSGGEANATNTTTTNATGTAAPNATDTNATSTTVSGNTTLAGTTSNAASTSAGQTPAPDQRNAAASLSVSVAAVVSAVLLVVTFV